MLNSGKMNRKIAYIIVLIGLVSFIEGLKNETKITCVLRPPSNLRISRSGDRLLLEWQSNGNYGCFQLHEVEVFLNGVHSQRIMTMRPNFPIDLPKPCVNVRVLVSSTDDSGNESEIISATYSTERPTAFGSVENIWWMVDPTRVIVTYFPPHPYENCDFRYEMVYNFMDTNIIIYNSTSTDIIHKFNYVEERLLCRYLSMNLTPILDGVRGDTWFENAVTDKFEIDIGPVSSLTVDVTKVLTITWTSPVYYEECPTYYTVEVINILSGEVLDSTLDRIFEWVFDYSSKGLYCLNVAVRVTSFFRDVSGGGVTRHIRLGPPPNGAC